MYGGKYYYHRQFLKTVYNDDNFNWSFLNRERMISNVIFKFFRLIIE
jgi:hypothetical protein